MNRIAVDTNVLLRATFPDDPRQAVAAAKALRGADKIAISTTCLAEFVWVLSRSYKRRGQEIAEAIRTLIGDDKVVVDRPAVEAGLAALDFGGDFADGVIAFEGRRMGGDVFATFDRRAAAHVAATGGRADLLG
ncbi:MAG TPA: type II toxin-antitoxin system VapC family toxin [Rhodoblastus sp.]|nr:type II toxin-antitoxin system VapC family toxin [Rhodoblastus sp.]